MAIFGGIGKRLGLGTAESIVTRVTGSPLAGAIAGEVSEGISGLGRTVSSDIGQGAGVSRAPQGPAETSRSGERGAVAGARYNIGISPALYTPPGQPGMRRGMAQPAAAGALVPFAGGAVTSGARALFPYLFGGAVAAAPIIIDSMGQEKKLRVTRKLKTQVRNAVSVFGPEAVAEQLGTDVNVVFYILTKKMRNDGAYVTKAAVRKTRQTVRKMKHLCDMYDDLRPAAKRRPPARRSSATTLIKN